MRVPQRILSGSVGVAHAPQWLCPFKFAVVMLRAVCQRSLLAFFSILVLAVFSASTVWSAIVVVGSSSVCADATEVPDVGTSTCGPLRLQL